MARQRVLERAGWVFWRCFASSFVRRRAEVVDDLLSTLSKLGIEPAGEGELAQASSSWVHRREADPLGLDVPAQSAVAEAQGEA